MVALANGVASPLEAFFEMGAWAQNPARGDGVIVGLGSTMMVGMTTVLMLPSCMASFWGSVASSWGKMSLDSDGLVVLLPLAAPLYAGAAARLVSGASSEAWA